jgi:putative membrane protein
MMKWRQYWLEVAMLAGVGVASVLSGIAPASRAVWLTEMFWAWGLVAILLVTFRKFRFSGVAYACFFVWCILQIIGAHWTFEHVPMQWLAEPLGLARNPYDRIAHFMVGWFAFPLAELYWRKGWARSVAASAFFAVMTTVAMAGVWEIVEWLYAAIDGGEAGAAFLGSQGDEWDAQKDILCDTLGALCSAALFMVLNRKESNERNKQ